MHLNTEVALDLIDGRLEIGQETSWHRHINTCARCVEVLTQWRQFHKDIKRAHLRSAPESDLEMTARLFKPAAVRLGSTLRAIAAEIVFDNLLQPAIAGARGSSTNAAQQLVMRAENFDIHVKIWGEPNHKRILGQLLPRTDRQFPENAAFHLLQSGERVVSTRSDEMGEFEFTDISEGDWSLQIDLPEVTVLGTLKIKD